MPEASLGEYTLGVGTNIETKAVFVSIKDTGTALKNKATEFNIAEGACVGGSSTDRAHKNAVRQELLALTDTSADAVEGVAQGNVEILNASGFHLTDPAAVSPAPVGTVSIQSIVNVASTKLGLILNCYGNVWAVVVESLTAPNTWTKVAVFTNLKDTVIPNLTPGTTYTFRVCAMAAGNQTSEWSIPMSAMST